MDDTWDYIVVGAGHNGLSAACTLATAGRSVLVLDQRTLCGGLSVSHPFVEGAPHHHLSIGAMDDALMAHSSLIEDLHLRGHGYRAIPLTAPYGWMSPEGDTLLLHSDFARTVEEIRYFSPRDAQAYQEVRRAIDFVMGAFERFSTCHPARLPKRDLARQLLALAVDRNLRKLIARMLATSAFEMIAETFQSEAMRGLWAFWASMFAPPTLPGTGIYLAGFGNVHRTGIFRPAGGMSGMIRAFEKCLLAQGGEIRLGHRVDQFLVADNRVRGVRIVDGQTLHARCGVLAGCAPQVALGALLPEDAKSEELRTRLDFIPANSVAVAPFKVDMAVAGPVTYPRAQARRAARDGVDVRGTTFMTGTLDQHIAQHQACLRGEAVAFATPLYFATLSANDRSIAPAGQDVLYLYANVPVDPIGGWDACKSSYSERILQAARHYIDGLDAEIGRVETSPRDFEVQFGAPRGCYFHVDMLPGRLLMNRPAPGLGGYKTPVEGLFLAGAGSHPGGGVCGWPGRLAAEEAMKSE
ncbi:MAG: NAD(P)/FAD-dependent oxidoreductase [Bacteroidales bacterium]|nr:NAD(P)/FAD-dependent oxidoreductase [Bacteroidales bacterium]